MYGLIGYPLTHSFSPAYFEEKFRRQQIDAAYRLFPLADIALFPALLREQGALAGLNVTIPHKTAVIPYLGDLSEEAAVIGAINCIRLEGGKTTGFNTDVTGFRDSLEPLLQPHHEKALILGTGGASLAVAYVLNRLKVPFLKVSRRAGQGDITYEALTPSLLQEHTLIVNTTPLGMSPDTDSCPPLPYDAVSTRHLLYDLVYTPEETLFLTKGREKGAAIKNGLEMLHLQAEAAWNIWTS